MICAFLALTFSTKYSDGTKGTVKSKVRLFAQFCSALWICFVWYIGFNTIQDQLLIVLGNNIESADYNFKIYVRMANFAELVGILIGILIASINL